jgi:putative transposase
MSNKQSPNKPKKVTEQPQRRTTYQFRLYPTKKQVSILERWLVWCCETYNAALDERRSAYRMAGLSLSYAHQCAELPACKEVRPELGEVPAQVLQDVIKRVDRALRISSGVSKRGRNPAIPALNRVSAMIR